MAGYIIKDPSIQTLDKLNQAGIDWLEWESPAILVNEDITLIGRIIGASNFETKNTEWEDIFVVTFTFLLPVEVKSSPRNLPYSADSAHGRSRANYIKLAELRYKDVAKVAQANFDAAQKSLAYSLAAYLRSVSLVQVHNEKADLDKLLLRFREQYRQLLAIPQVEAVRFCPGQLLIYTKPLQATGSFSDRMHKLGKFLIVINISEPSGNFFACYNLAGAVSAGRGEMQAPYVYSDGRICPDEILESLVELVAQMEYATAIEVVLQFLETAHDDAMGKYLLHWPHVALNNASK